MDGRWRIEERLHDAPLLLDAVLPGEADAVPDERGLEKDLVRRRALPTLLGELDVELIRSAPVASARRALTISRTPVDGSSFTTSWFGSGRSCERGPNAIRGGFLNTSRISVCTTGSRLPVRMKNGTPDHRQLSMSRRNAA